MLPDYNNVYGHVFAPEGLEPVLTAVRKLGCWGRAGIKTSGFNGERTLHLSGEDAEFETTPLGGTEHLFNGAVAGSSDEVIKFVSELAEALKADGIRYGFEIYDDAGELTTEIPSC